MIGRILIGMMGFLFFFVFRILSYEQRGRSFYLAAAYDTVAIGTLSIFLIWAGVL